MVCTAWLLSGCHIFHKVTRVNNACNKPQPYQSAHSVPPLQMPPGVDSPDTHGALKIPELKEPAPPPRSVRDPCLDAPPAFATPSERRPLPTES